MSLWVGVMSGTSLDGIDVAVARFDGDAERPEAFELVAFETEPYPPDVRARIREAIEDGTAGRICDLDRELGERIGAAVSATLERAGIDPGSVRAVGSHGQTIWHRPPEEGRTGCTLQLGGPAIVAERTGIGVVSDLRARDMAAGGEGAPLVPYLDDILLRGPEARAIQNIGGMANVTALPPAGGGTALAFDTGPGMALIDAAVERLTGGAATFDPAGRMAAAGAVVEPALAEWLADPFFARPPPRSTGRERFSGARLAAWLARHDSLAREDAIATLTEVTARSIAESYRWIPSKVDRCYVCGGGARNVTLMGRLGALLAPVPVRDLSELGLDPDAREAVAFALFARQHRLGIPANAPWATGAGGARVLGSWTPA